MKKKESIDQSKHTSSILLYVILAIGPLLFLLDYFLYYDAPAISAVAKLTQSIITVIAGIWITCYLLFMELFKDRYPIASLKKDLLPHMRNNFILVLYDVIYGGILVFFDYSFCGSLWFLSVSLITIIRIFKDVFNAHQTLMVSSYVSKFFSQVSGAFNSHTGTIDPLFLNEIKFILNESLSREEFYTAQTIIEHTGISFRDFLGNLVKLSDKIGAVKVEDSFRDIVAFNIKELELCKNIQSELLIRSLLDEQEYNLIYCIENKLYEWYKIYLHEFNIFVFQMQKEENSQLTDRLYGIYYRLLKKLIKENKDEWINYTLEEMESLTFTYIYVFNKNNIQNYVFLLIELLEYCVKKEYDSYYEIFFENLKKFTTAKYIEHGGFNEVKAFYASLFSSLSKKDFNRALELTELVLKKSIRTHDDASLLEFKLFAITELANSNQHDSTSQSRLFEYHIDTLVEAIGLNKDYNGYIAPPDFYSRIEKQDCPKEVIDETIDSIKKLLHHCIVTDYLPPFYTLLKGLRESLSKTTQQQKEIQKNLLDIYFWLFRKTIVLVNQQFFELTFDLFQRVLEDMDKNRAISSSLGNYLISSISKSPSGTRHDNEKLTILSIDLLFSFMSEGNESYFVISNTDQRKFLYRSLFNIGTECIENNFEEGLRKVSNALGWLIIYNLKHTPQGHTSYLIGRARELFYLSKRMDVSKKTQMFLLTLFTTVGAFCCKDPSFKPYRNEIIESIKDESIERIKIAVSLRTSENDMWNDLYENQTEYLTKEFLKSFEHKVSKKTS